MMNVADELRRARSGGYAIGAFNTNNLEVTKAICKAAAESGAPILVQTSPGAIEYAGLPQIFHIVSDEIAASGSKAAIHLDHAIDFLLIKKAIDIGYPSVMFDGSRYGFAENAAMTEKVVAYAHRRGVAVEAEVGVIGREEGGRLSGKAVMSAPDEVKHFVELTGVDSIAVSIGNEHGAPEGEKINLRLLGKIAEVVHIPLVLHGASGLSEGEIREAVSLGIAKVNIDTNIKRAFAGAIESSKAEDYRQALKAGMIEAEKIVAKYIKLLRGD